MVDKLTPRLGLPEPFLTNPLKVDVGRLQQALEMIDSNAVMLTDWDITADGWQKMGTIKGLAQGKIAASLMVVTGTGFANILFQTGDGTVTTVGDPARMTVSAQTNLGANTPTVLDGRVVETAADEYEIWFEIAVGTSPRKWSGLLIAGNGASIDWTHAVGTQPAGGVDVQIARALTSFDMASETRTAIGTLLSTGHIGAGVVSLDYLTAVDLKNRLWKTGELVRIKKADATDAKGFPPALVSADPSATGWFIRCLSINDTRTVKEFEFTSESAGIIRAYKARLSGTTWSVAKVYTSLDKPTANDISALGMRAPVTGTDVVDLNDMCGPDYYGATAIKSTASAVAANNYPFDEVGTVLVLPFGDTFSCTQLYVTQSGRVAARSYDGSTWTIWRKQANSGVNDDITSMTGLSGPLKLGGDAAGDYDAVTLRQLKATTGTGGATMNGVVNSFIGAVDWFNGSRALVPAGYIPADGGVYSRAAYPELWNAISKGILANVSDAEWLAGVSTGAGATLKTSTWAHRGKYSTGGEAGTAPAGSGVTDAWFRVPDLNGVQTGSASGLFLRGSGSGSISVGTVAPSSLPDIQGNVTTNNGWMFTQGGGALKPYGSTSLFAPDTSPTTAATQAYLEFKASYSSEIYGKITQYLDSSGTPANWGATEVKPPQVVGIWLIRASGSFQAANTNFSVIAGDATKPGNNTQIVGGEIISDYQVGGVSECKVTLKAQGTIGGFYGARLSIINNSKGGTPQNLDFMDDGSLNVPATLKAGSINATGQISTTDTVNAINQINVKYGPGAHEAFVIFRNQSNLNMGAIYSERDGDVTISTSVNGGTGSSKYFQFFKNGSAICSGSWGNGSDERIKTNIQRVKGALKAVYGWRGATWEQDFNGKSFGIGLVAQDVEKDCPEAIGYIPEVIQSTGKVIKDVRTLDAGQVSAAYHTEAIRTLVDLLELALTDPVAAKAQIAAIKA